MIKEENKLVEGKDEIITAGIIVKKDGKEIKSLSAATIDRTAKWLDKNTVVLKFNNIDLLAEDGNQVSEVEKIMAMGTVDLDVNGETVKVKVLSNHVFRDKEGKKSRIEIWFEKVL